MLLQIFLMWQMVQTTVFGQDCPRIITRKEWGALPPRDKTNIGNNLKCQFVHHSDTPPCSTQADCSARIRAIQNYHMNDPSRMYSDIGYSFLVGGDGNVYEGRGWNVQGAHTLGYNSDGYGTCFVGNFTATTPTAAAVASYMKLLKCAFSLGKVVSSYKLYGHRQAGTTECPGDKLYAMIQKWPGWTPGKPAA